MRISVTLGNPAEVRTPALVVPQGEGQPPQAEGLDARLDGLLARLTQSGGLKGKSETQEVIHTLGRLPAERLMVMGMGKVPDLDLKRLTDWSLRTARLRS